MSILLFTLLGCDAPRINPFDPENPDYAFVTLNGTVATMNFPNKSISGAIVIWSPANINVYTDNNGSFKINNILPVNGKLIFQKPGYQPDTVDVVWGNSKLLTYQINLKMTTILDSISIYTNVTDQFTLPARYRSFIFT